MSDLTARFRLQRPGFELDAALDIPARGVTGIFGPSGSGKTTLLRCLAGLEPQARGHLRLGEETWQDDATGVRLPVHHRPIGVVFQDARLFPHLDVRANLDYGRRRAGKRAVTDDRNIIQLLGLEQLLARYPHQLSGGEAQRVAIARALLTQPRLLLMDEPLASLDPARKAEILPYLEDLHRELALPVIYVSHALEEILRLADQLILMQAGRTLAHGPLPDMLARLDLPLSHGTDAGVVIEATVSGHDDHYHLTEARFEGGQFTVARQHVELGETLRLRVQARDVSLALSRTEDSSILNVLEATVTEIAAEPEGRATVRLSLGATALLARITEKSRDRLGLVPGMRVYAQVKSVALAE